MTVQDYDNNLSKLIVAFEGFVKRFAKNQAKIAQGANIHDKIDKISLCQKAISLVKRVLGKQFAECDLEIYLASLWKKF